MSIITIGCCNVLKWCRRTSSENNAQCEDLLEDQSFLASAQTPADSAPEKDNSPAGKRGDVQDTCDNRCSPVAPFRTGAGSEASEAEGQLASNDRTAVVSQGFLSLLRVHRPPSPAQASHVASPSAFPLSDEGSRSKPSWWICEAVPSQPPSDPAETLLLQPGSEHPDLVTHKRSSLRTDVVDDGSGESLINNEPGVEKDHGVNRETSAQDVYVPDGGHQVPDLLNKGSVTRYHLDESVATDRQKHLDSLLSSDNALSTGIEEGDLFAADSDDLQPSFGLSGNILSVDREQWTSYTKHKLAEVQRLYEDEKLISAWVETESCLRFVAHCTEQSGLKSTESDEPLKSLIVAFLTSDLYTGMYTKIYILLDMFQKFNLEDRFDIRSFVPEGSSTFVSARSRLASKESENVGVDIKPDNSLDGASQLSAAFNGAGTANKFFRRKVSAMAKNRKTSKRLPSSSADGHRLTSPKKPSRFHLRRQRGSRDQGITPGLPYMAGMPSPYSAPDERQQSQQQQTAWTEDTQKGLMMAHRVNNNGTISVRIKAKIRIPLFQVLAILYETQLYDKWVPYCKKCNRIMDLTKASMIVQQLCEYPWPIKQKENLSYCFGVDGLDDFGSVIITSYGLSEEATNFLGYPLPPPTKKIPRVPSSSFLFLLSPFDAGRTTQLELYASIDPAVNTLRSVILPIVKVIVLRSIKGFFHKIGHLATHFESAGYAAQVKANPVVYEWIQRRIHENVSAGKFLRGSSMMTLCFDDLKEPAK